VIAVVGDKEAAAGQVAPRSRAAGNQPPVDLARFVDEVAAQAGFPGRPAESSDAGSPAAGGARVAGAPAGQ